MNVQAPGNGHFLKLQPGDSTEEETDITYHVFSIKSYSRLSIFKALYSFSLEVIALF
jgi:hypothetical protein